MADTPTLTSNLSAAILEVYSSEILFQAQPLLRFDQVAFRKNEFGVQPGQTVNFLRYNALQDGDTTLTEGTPMTKGNVTAQQIQITVAEHGKAIQVSELLIRSSFDDVMESTAQLLGRHYANNLDSRFRDVLMTATNVKYAGGKSDAASLLSTDTFDTTLVADMAEVLATNKAPKLNGDAYLCFVTPHQARSLREDSKWLSATQFGAPERVYRGEIGRYLDVRFIETTKVQVVKTDGSIYSDGSDTGSNVSTPNFNSAFDVHRAVMVGDHALGWGVSLDVELRDDGVEDFGRFHSLAWYSIDGMGLIEPGHVVVGVSA